jgi:hypothetical protein
MKQLAREGANKWHIFRQPGCIGMYTADLKTANNRPMGGVKQHYKSEFKRSYHSAPRLA